jgi:hypothetical protein
LRLEKRLPPVPGSWIEEIDPGTATRPTPAFVFTVWASLNEESLFGRFLVDWVFGDALEMRVNDYDHLRNFLINRWFIMKRVSTNLAPKSSNIVDHVNWVREVPLVPNHILVLLRVLDIKPEDINWHIFLIKPLLHCPDILWADVVPSALVIPQTPVGRKHGGTSELGVLLKDVLRCRARKEEEVQNTRLRDPVCFRRLIGSVTDINPCFGPDGVEDSNGRVCGVGVQDRDRTVDGHGRRCEVFKDVTVVETIRVAEEGWFSGGGRECQSGGMLWNTIDGSMVGEINVERQGFRS